MFIRLMIIALLLLPACRQSPTKGRDSAAAETMIAAKCFAAHNLWSVYVNQNPSPISPPISPPASSRDREMFFVRATWELKRVSESPDAPGVRDYIVQFSKELSKRPADAHALIAKCTAIEDADPSFVRSVPQLKRDFHQPPGPPITAKIK